MKRSTLTFALFVMAASPSVAEKPFDSMQSGALSARPQTSLNALAPLAGANWIYREGLAKMSQRFQWEAAGRVLVYSGMDYDGYAVAGVYEFDPDLHEIVGRQVYRGTILKSVVTSTDNGFVENFIEDGQIVRRVNYAWQGRGELSVLTESHRSGQWKPIRSGELLKATAGMVEALGWLKRTPETEAAERAARAEALKARPSFGKRLGNAVEDGIVAGVQDGLHDGLHDGLQARVRGAIAPGAYPKGAPATVVQSAGASDGQ